MVRGLFFLPDVLRLWFFERVARLLPRQIAQIIADTPCHHRWLVLKHGPYFRQQFSGAPMIVGRSRALGFAGHEPLIVPDYFVFVGGLIRAGQRHMSHLFAPPSVSAFHRQREQHALKPRALDPVEYNDKLTARVRVELRLDLDL